MNVRRTLAVTVLSAALFSLTVSVRAADAPIDAPAVVQAYAAQVAASYADTQAAAKGLQGAVDAFIAEPSAEGLANARKAWLAAREQYGQTEAFRFYGSPIDDDKGPEGRINAWPMDESFVDGIEGKSRSGLIYNTKFKISKKSIAAMNERGGEENIATGWHGIEFLLWGQDRSETGPDNRSFDDYADGKLANADRRRLYLKTATDLLVDDRSYVATAWTAGGKNDRAKFEKGGQESVRKMLVGLGSLSRGELAGERMDVALNSQNQEDEHSCFSDNTHRDINFADGHFVIGCPKADRLATFSPDGTLQRLQALPQACAVAVDANGQLWAAGRAGTTDLLLTESLQLDNHWLA